jgi:hypothetical protein
MTARHPTWARITLPTMWGKSLHDAIGQVRLVPMRRLLAAAVLTLVGLASWLLCLGVIAKAIGLVLPAQTIVMIGRRYRVRAAIAYLDTGHRRARGDVRLVGRPGGRSRGACLRRLRNRLRAASPAGRVYRNCRPHLGRLQAPAPHGLAFARLHVTLLDGP